VAVPGFLKQLAAVLYDDAGNPIKTSASSDSVASPAGFLHTVMGVVQSGGNFGRLWSANTSGDTGSGANYPPAAAFDFTGSVWVRRRTPTVFKVVALGAATAETTIWTPAAGKKFRLMGFLLTPGAGSTLTFKDNTGGTTIFAARGATDTPITPSGLGNGILSAAADNVLTVTRGTSCTLDGVVWGCEE
jgi:hypothetical protein